MFVNLFYNVVIGTAVGAAVNVLRTEYESDQIYPVHD